MAKNSSSEKITPYRGNSWINVGSILFVFIFLYMFICFIGYLTEKHTTTYEVAFGSIAGNYRYTALALKHETVVRADTSGNVTYYARGGVRTPSGSAVCSIDRVRRASAEGLGELEKEDYDQLRLTMSSFILHYDPLSFQDVYSLKADTESILLQAQSSDALLEQNSATVVRTSASGFISYTIDGMEELKEENLTPELFYRNLYQMQNLRFQETVRSDDPLFKVITGEDWYIYFPVSEDLSQDLGQRSTIRFRLLKDDTTFSAPFSIVHTASGLYGKISLSNSLVRYTSDRYLEIELLIDRVKGLKIPLSAIGEKQFYRIPEEYVIKNKDSQSEITVIRESFGNDGSSNVEYVTATVYDIQDKDYLVDTSLFHEGDYIVVPGGSKKHPVDSSDLVTIKGVYNINKGFAVFRQVDVWEENEEFCIVSPDNPFGLSAHDYIALDASSVSDDMII